MTNWTETLPNFTPELQKKWETKGFSAEETKEWIEGFGLEPEESDFADWLKKKYNITAEEFLGDDDMEELRSRHKKELEEEGVVEEDNMNSSNEFASEEENGKTNAQQWLNQNYPKKEREDIKELYINKNLEGELDLSDLTKLEKVFISHFVDENKLEIKDIEKYKDKIIKLVNAQEWLENQEEYNTEKKREKIEKLDISDKNLEGHLHLSDFGELKELNCQENYLTNISWLTLNPEKLVVLCVYNNNIQPTDIEVFSNFTNLKELYFGNDNERIERGSYNNFFGSLASLKNLTKLEILDIDNTNVETGLEFLPESVGKLYCEAKSFTSPVIFEPKVSKIREQFSPCDYDFSVWKEWKRRGLDSEEIKQWKEVGLEGDEYDFAAYLKNQKKYDFAEIKTEDIKNSREDFNNWIKVAQNYLDNYSEEERSKIISLDISDKGLEGELDLTEFFKLEKLNCSTNKLTSLNIRNLEKLIELNCCNNQLTSLNLSGCENLESLKADNGENENFNELSDISFLSKLPNPKKLKVLHLAVNNIRSDLIPFARFTNLEDLDLGMSGYSEKTTKERGNKFYGSLESLKDLTKLKSLFISNTDIDSGIEYLPNSLEEFYCANDQIPEAKVSKIREELNKIDSPFFLDGDKYVKKVTAQQWLENKYPDKEEVEKIDLIDLCENVNVEGELVISDFPKLRRITSSEWYWVAKVNKVVIKDCPQLEKAEIKYFQDSKELSVDNCQNLTEFDCYYNYYKLEKLDIIDCSSLKSLICSFNELTELNLKGLTNLKKLDCSSNKLTNLDINDLQLKELNISNNDGLAKLSEQLKKEDSFVFHNDKYVKKQNAEQWLNENFPKDEKSKLSGYEGKKREDVKTLNISEKGLSGKLDLTGFTGLTELYCYGNGLTSLDLNNCTKLNKVYCYLNQLAELELGNLNDLSEFSCYGNNLTNCDFVKQLNPKKITLLSIRDNNFAEQSLEIFSDFVNLKTLRLENTDKERIEKGVYNRFYRSMEHLKGINKLEILGVSNTDLDSGVEYLPNNIKEIYCSIEERPNSKLKNIKEQLDSYQKEADDRNTKKRLNETYPDKSATKSIDLCEQKLKGCLDLGEYRNLEVLDCHNNELTSIDISKNKELKKLNCSNNKLKEVNLERNANLKELYCNDNELEKLDISKNSNLTSLDCEKNNQLTELLGIENCDKLTDLKFEEDNNGLSESKKSFLIKLVKKNEIKGQWKKIEVQQWLDEKYPKDGWTEDVGQKTKEKKRQDITELDISSKELEGEIRLEDFEGLQYLTCYNNQLIKIDLSDCPKLVGLDCRNNKLTELKFNAGCNLKELRASGNEFEKMTDIFGEIREGGKGRCSDSNLQYLDISNNKISDGKTSSFNKFKNLRVLYIGNTDERRGENEFDISLEGLRNLNELVKINVFKVKVKGENSSQGKLEKELEKLKDNEKMLKKLEKVYYHRSNKDKNSSNKEINEKKDSGEKSVPESIKKIDLKSNTKKTETKSSLDGYCGRDGEGDFYDIKKLRESNQSAVSSRESTSDEIKVIVKLPILSGFEDSKVEKGGQEDYFKSGRLIYPSEEAGFDWEITSENELPPSELPRRLCEIGEDNLSKKIEELEEKMPAETELENRKISVKTRVECIDDAKYYAILSYTWDGSAKKDIKWSPENAQERLSPGGEKSLDKALKTLKVLNEFHLFKDRRGEKKIKYLWMDQMCINQNSLEEKEHEVPMMRQYYGNSIVTLVAIHDSIGKETMKKLLNSFETGKAGLIYPNEIVKNSLPILKKIIDSNWFKRSWTYQEGFLSKQTIFMFDDFLIDGRFMALVWKLKQFSETDYDECMSIKELCENKIATPVGWVYYDWEEGKEKGYNLSDQASLRLNEALWAVKDRGRSIALDGIYSIIGLLPYGKKVKVNYERDSESVLQEIMLIAVEEGYGEPLAWHGSGSKKLGLCWIPEVISNSGLKGSSNVKGSIKIDTKKGEKLEFDHQNKGIKITGSEYIITWKDKGIYKAEIEETVDGGLWRREVYAEREGEEKGFTITLSGTKEGIEAVDKGRMLIVPNREEWKSDKPFALLALRIKDSKGLGRSELEMLGEHFEKTPSIQEIRLDDKEKLVDKITDKEVKNISTQEYEKLKNILQRQINKSISRDDLVGVYHRIDLVRIEEGWSERLEKEAKNNEKQFIIGFNNQEITQEYQAQIEILSKK